MSMTNRSILSANAVSLVVSSPSRWRVAFSHVGKTLFEVFKYLGIKDIAYNQPASLPYPTENPWK